MYNELEIRAANENDAHEISELIIHNAEVSLKPHYSEKQWDIFVSYYSSEVLKNKMIDQYIYCAELNKKIVGTVALDGNFVVGFYTNLEYLNKGIGKKLLHHIELVALNNGLSEIQLAASPVSVAYYIKNGWQKIETTMMTYFDTDFEETLMKKALK
jgi:N-acetylglutamate synthase-like GNAT family acetyltransferase